MIVLFKHLFGSIFESQRVYISNISLEFYSINENKIKEHKKMFDLLDNKNNLINFGFCEDDSDNEDY